DALPLRYLATAHRLALAGDAPLLARHYPSCGGAWDGADITADFLATAARQRQEFVGGVRRNVQTNEVARAAVLASSFALIARRHGAAIDMLEIGSSAGLLSRWDLYHYDTGRSELGDRSSPVSFGPSWWTTNPPDLDVEVRVRHRAASDITPIDCTTADGRLTMLSFIWPDQLERIERLRAALTIAARAPLAVEAADAGSWLARQLARGPQVGAATVVFHSIVWQYLPPATRDGVRESLASAGALASDEAPLLWLRMEPDTAEHANVRVTTWPGAAEEVIAAVGYHGAGIQWFAGV
ncbi:MAG TPA: DUF2332 domain-containing protein, partial [Ilumatobacteraceae bacterium]